MLLLTVVNVVNGILVCVRGVAGHASKLLRQVIRENIMSSSVAALADLRFAANAIPT